MAFFPPSPTSARQHRRLPSGAVARAIWAPAALSGLLVGALLGVEALRAGRLPQPSLSPILAASPVVQLHLLAALACAMLGGAILALPKGSRLHRALGYAWSALLALAALSSFFILDLNNGRFSPIHGLSVFTLATLCLAIPAARGGRIALHRRAMESLYWLGVLLAGAFTLMPGRLLHQALLG